jgi:hypothetical protein
MTLLEDRRAIRPLLDQGDGGSATAGAAADAVAVYYAFHHPDQKIQTFTYPPGESRARGYVCLARTGMDLFRPVVTLRLPESAAPGGLDLEAAAELLHLAIPEGMDVILNAPGSYQPLLSGLFNISKEEILGVYVLDRGRFQPIINVLVSRSDSFNNLPRYIIRETGATSGRGDILASAGLNWQSPRYAEIYVHTKSPHRRQGLGQSVVASVVQHVLESGRTPLYVVSEENQASIQLAELAGFVDIGVKQILIEGSLLPGR